MPNIFKNIKNLSFVRVNDSQVIYDLGNINDKRNFFIQYNDLYSKLFLIKINPSKSIYVVEPQEVFHYPEKFVVYVITHCNKTSFLPTFSGIYETDAMWQQNYAIENIDCIAV